MRGFIFINIIYLIVISAAIAGFFLLVAGDRMSAVEILLFSLELIVLTPIDCYLVVCIISLYLQIKEESSSSGTQILENNMNISQHQRPFAKCENKSYSYNSVPQPAPPGHSTQIVIPFQTMHPAATNFKPQAV